MITTQETVALLKKYAKPKSKAFEILLKHSTSVKNLVLKIADKNQHLDVDRQLLEAAAMLHDIGVIETYAPSIGCVGDHPYIRHGYLGREILEAEGLHEIAPFCERHTGTGISKAEIIRYKLPLPHRDMIPLSTEEKMLCYADKFFSKSGKNLTQPKKIKKIYRNLSKYGEDKARKFDDFIGMFGMWYVYDLEKDRN